jgi:RNA polymerase sigma-70 factor (ECF subfamily)
VTGRPRPHALAALPAPDGADDEAALVDDLRRGDVDALARAFDRWHARVRVLARRLLSDAAAAEDVVQEVFATLPRAAGRFRGDADLAGFILGMAVKRARRHRRAAARRVRALARLAAGGEGRPGPRDPEQDAWRRELGLRLGAALDRLPPAQREAFVLCEVEELTSPEAAAIADVPEATVRTRLHHARKRLRELLAEEHRP